jgi:hypothetical protein
MTSIVAYINIADWPNPSINLLHVLEGKVGGKIRGHANDPIPPQLKKSGLI